MLEVFSMKVERPTSNVQRPTWFLRACLCWLFFAPVLLAQEDRRGAAEPTRGAVQVIAIQGTNWWIAPSGAADWVLASTRMPQEVRTGDRIRTGRHTRLFLRTPNLGGIQIPPLSTLEISL